MTGRRDMTLSPDAQILKAATRALVKAAGGVEAGEIACGRAKSRLSAYSHVNTPDFMPIDVIAALEEVTHGTAGHPIVTRILARRAGYALIKLPDAPAGDTDWHAAIGAASKEVGEVIGRVCEAMPGGVTAAEVRERRIVEEVDQAIDALVRLRALAEGAPE